MGKAHARRRLVRWRDMRCWRIGAARTRNGRANVVKRVVKMVARRIVIVPGTLERSYSMTFPRQYINLQHRTRGEVQLLRVRSG